MHLKKIKKYGFTLIELLVVISIIGLLSTLAIVSLSASRAKARDVKRLADLASIQKALELYNDKYGHYPYESQANAAPGYGYIGSNYTGGINAMLKEFMPTLPKDPRDDGANYYYYYDGRQSCTGGPGTIISVIFAKTMEATPTNRSSICTTWGGEGGAGGANAYHILITPTGL